MVLSIFIFEFQIVIPELSESFGEHGESDGIGVMVYVMHAQNLGEYALKILFFQSDLLDGCGELNGSVEGVHGSEHVILSVGEQKEENTESDEEEKKD